MTGHPDPSRLVRAACGLLALLLLVAAPLAAQGTLDRCAPFRAELERIARELRTSLKPMADRAAPVVSARRRALFATTVVARYDRGSELIVNAAPALYSATAMRAFMTRHQLPDDLEELLDEPGRFYLDAAVHLTKRLRAIEAEIGAISTPAIAAMERTERDLRQCENDALPLDLPRHPDGRPILTDGAISRWIDATIAARQTGVAPWRAGRMTQQDFAGLDGDIRGFLAGVNLARFTSEEIAALRNRRRDIEQTLQTSP